MLIYLQNTVENIVNYFPRHFLKIFPERTHVEILFLLNGGYLLTPDSLSLSPFLTFHSIILPCIFLFFYFCLC